MGELTMTLAKPKRLRVRLINGSAFWLAQWRDGRTRNQRRIGNKSQMQWMEAVALCAKLEYELHATTIPQPDESPRVTPNVRLKSNGRYWQSCWSDADGLHVRGIGAKSRMTEANARELCQIIEYELGKTVRAAFTPPGAIRLREWIDRYANQRTDLSAATLKIGRWCAEYLTRHFPHDPAICEITRSEAAEWRAALAHGELSKDNPLHQAAPSDATVCKHTRGARALFGEALRQGLIRENPFDRLRGTPRRMEKQWAYITADQLHLILRGCPDSAWRCLFALCRFAGLRRGEALSLRWEDVNFATNRLAINARCQTITTKKRRRIVPIEPPLRPTRLAEILKSAAMPATSPEALVCAGIGGRVNAQGWQIVSGAGVDRYDKLFHTLRKNCEMDLAARYPQFVVAEWMGHSIEVSANHYLRVPEELYGTVAMPENVTYPVYPENPVIPGFHVAKR